MSAPTTVTTGYILPDRATSIGIGALRATTLSVRGTTTLNVANAVTSTIGTLSVTGTSTIDTLNVTDDSTLHDLTVTDDATLHDETVDESTIAHLIVHDRMNLPSHAIDPVAATNGDIYHNSVTGKLMMHALGSWVSYSSHSEYAMFYGLTAGTGNNGPTDYAATIPVKTTPGTGRVPFPREGPNSHYVVGVDGSSCILTVAGTYHVIFKVHTTEPGQLQLELDGVDIAESVASDYNPTAGGHEIVGDCLITSLVDGAVLAVVNPTGNSTALTVTPANGALTHANAQSITIFKM